MKVCRICLSQDGRLYPITSNGLRSLYYQLTGVVKLEVDIDKGMPQWVCPECGLRLMSYNKLRQKSLRSHQILTDLLDSGQITEEDINQIDREKYNLQSNLSYCILDLGIVHEYVEDIQETDVTDCKKKLDINEFFVKEVDEPAFGLKTEDDSDDCHLETVSNTENNSACENEDLTDIEGSSPSAYSATSAKKILKHRLKSGNAKVRLDKNKKLNKYNTVNKKLTKKVKTEVKKENKRVKTEVKRVVKEGNQTTKRIKKQGTKKISEPCQIEDVFTIQTLSLEEQRVELEKRKYTKNYSDAPFKCNDCFKGFNTEVTFTRHRLMHSDKWGKIECNICKRRFRTMDTYCCHMKSHKTRYSCKECPFTASQRTVAVLHRLKHKGKIYKCPHCSVEFVNRSSYLSHVRIKHVSSFVCEFCGFSFVNTKGVALHKNLKHSLEINNKIVSTDGPACATCKIKFVSDKALNTHLRVSHPQKFGREKRNNDDDGYGKAKIICELCGVKTADGGAYIYHIRRYHPNQNATNHPSRHKPFTCEQCGRVFMTQANLQSHALVHTDVKPFECDDCNKRFKSKNNVLIHMRNVHLPKVHKVYSCTICGREFNDPGNRTRHMLVHSNLRPFNCDICGSSFKTKYEVKVHSKHVHLKQPWPKKKDQGSRQGF